VCFAITREFDGLKSVAGGQPSMNETTSEALAPQPAPPPVASFSRPQSLLEPNPDAETLRTYAARIGLYFGSMEDSMHGNGWETAWVQNTLGSEFNLMEPGNQLKWWTTQPTQNTFDFSPGDSLIDFAIAHHMKVRGHNLLWGMANPDWLGNGPARTYETFTGKQLENILVNHIQTVMGHYRDRYPDVVKWWDVTNEVMGWNNKFNSDGILWTNIGTNPDRADYLRVAFRTARATDSKAILCMNDWGNEGSVSDRTQNMINTVKALKAEGIPIDCVGMEAHLDSASAPTYAQVLKVMQAYADMGVQVQVTEFDIQAPRSAPDWITASTIATNILKACVDSPNCTAFNNWGFSQALYLNDAGKRNTVTMLPWDTRNQMSPEYSAMRTVLKSGVH
jgi:endo-1,4-beta-xylanase